MGTKSPAEIALYEYMCTWRLGARGAMMPPSLEQNEAAKAGFEAGQKAQNDAYGKACKKYKAKLSILR